MKKNKAIAIFCLLFIILCIFVVGSSISLNNKEINKNIMFAKLEQPNVEGGSSIKYTVSMDFSLLVDVQSCENSSKELIKIINVKNETKNVYACVFNDINQVILVDCGNDNDIQMTVPQPVYGLNNNGAAFARFCQKPVTSSGTQNNESQGVEGGATNSGTEDKDSDDEEQPKDTIEGVIDNMDTSSYDEIETNNDYESLCNNVGFKNATRIIGIIIMVIKWLVPLVLMITGMIDFGKAVISSDDNALSVATQTFIKRLIIAVIVPLLPGLLYYLIDLFANTNDIAESDNFISCTDCLRHPFNDCIDPKE